MNDFDYDALQKKRIAASAKHRVCGSKSRKCSLPHDNLTPAQIKAMSGDPATYALNMPMDYGTFKSMPADLQQRYLDSLHDRFGVGLCHISTDLFTLSKPALHMYAKRVGLKGFGGVRRPLTDEESEVWLRWIQQDAEKPAAVCEEIAEETVEEVEEIEEIAEEQYPLQVAELSATFTGKFDPERFIKWMAMLPMPEGKVKIRVEVTGHEEIPYLFPM